MKKSFVKIRHIQEANILLEKRNLKEQNTPPAPITGGPASTTGNTTNTQVKKCQEMMTNSGAPGASSTMSINGTNVTVEFKGTVSPEFQGYYINVDSKPYCFIPSK